MAWCCPCESHSAEDGSSGGQASSSRGGGSRGRAGPCRKGGTEGDEGLQGASPQSEMADQCYAWGHAAHACAWAVHALLGRLLPPTPHVPTAVPRFLAGRRAVCDMEFTVAARALQVRHCFWRLKVRGG